MRNKETWKHFTQWQNNTKKKKETDWEVFLYFPCSLTAAIIFSFLLKWLVAAALCKLYPLSFVFPKLSVAISDLIDAY